MKPYTVGVKGIKSIKKSKKSKQFDIAIDLDLPDLGIFYSIGKIGAAYSAELTDFIKDNWMHGRSAGGDGRGPVGEALRKKRESRKRATEYGSGLKVGSRAPNALYSKYIKDMTKKYSKRSIVRTEIEGVKYKQRIKATYLPEPNSNRKVYDSGLMHDSLNLRLVKSRVVQGIQQSAWVRVRVAATRDAAAKYVGGLSSEYIAQFAALPNRYPGAFRMTNEALQNAIDWASEKNTQRIMAKARRIISTINSLTKGLSRLIAS